MARAERSRFLASGTLPRFPTTISASSHPRILVGDDHPDGEDVLPGFDIQVSDIFES